ncbi:hypothetical protein [Kitasatospora sp. NBC_01266]|uniref:hypothetical protein n=1 Tax=Kitasatospora sp. NBC_01266 TaxID=2903572 RepID=UPI002E2F0DC0|nr:hypothetical protein [Kitasatospora sp. NBC_01266]
MTARTRQRVRRAVTKAALVGTAVAAALSLTATGANATVGAGIQTATFTLAQGNWSSNYATYNANNGYEIILQTDGNFVLYNGNGTALWASGTDGKGVTQLDWSQSGYVKLLNSSNGVVCTLGALSPAPGGQAVLQNDGNFVFYNTAGNATWATNTYNGQQGNLDYCYT